MIKDSLLLIKKMLQHINTSKTFHCSLCETLINIYKTDSKGEEETLTIG